MPAYAHYTPCVITSRPHDYDQDWLHSITTRLNLSSSCCRAAKRPPLFLQEARHTALDEVEILRLQVAALEAKVALLQANEVSSSRRMGRLEEELVSQRAMRLACACLCNAAFCGLWRCWANIASALSPMVRPTLCKS